MAHHCKHNFAGDSSHFSIQNQDFCSQVAGRPDLKASSSANNDDDPVTKHGKHAAMRCWTNVYGNDMEPPFLPLSSKGNSEQKLRYSSTDLFRQSLFSPALSQSPLLPELELPELAELPAPHPS